MQLIKPSDQIIIELMSWFTSEEELSLWSGPNFRYPYDLTSFKSDLKLDSLNSYVMISQQNDLLAFGQYYLRAERCHLGRLVVKPSFRRQGMISRLINMLSERGKSRLKTQSCSLFVLESNTSAIQAYKKLGFSIVEYPKTMPLENCFYMVQI